MTTTLRLTLKLAAKPTSTLALPKRQRAPEKDERNEHTHLTNKLTLFLMLLLGPFGFMLLLLLLLLLLFPRFMHVLHRSGRCWVFRVTHFFLPFLVASAVDGDVFRCVLARFI